MMLRFLLAAAFVLTLLPACSSEGGPGEQVTVSGTVTDDASSSKTSAPIEGAAVTAASVSARGSLTTLAGSATTDASGSFSLSTDATTTPVVVSASASGFSSRVLLEAGAATSARATAPPMTAETAAEADIYLLARAQNSSASVADAVFFVTAEVATDLRAGAVAQADVAAALAASVTAEQAAAADQEEDVPTDEPAETRRDDYAMLRTALASAGSASARADAMVQFETNYADAYARAGLSARASARIQTARAKAVVKYSQGLSASARLAVRRRARIAAARATRAAVEASFEANGASTSTQSSLRSFGNTLIASLNAATTDAQMADAEAAYASTIRTRLIGEGVSSFQLSFAVQAATTARATLNTSVGLAPSAEAVATAVSAFYTTVEGAARDVFIERADFAVEVVTLISVY